MQFLDFTIFVILIYILKFDATFWGSIYVDF